MLFPSGHTASSFAAAYVLSRYFKEICCHFLGSGSSYSLFQGILIHALSIRYICGYNIRYYLRGK